MAERDVITMLSDQHNRMRDLFAEVNAAKPEARQLPFEQLVRLLAVHETAEEEVVHPAVLFVGGTVAANARILEEAQAKGLLEDLETIGPNGDAFPERLAQLESAILEHASREEAEEFPILRERYPEAQLQAMAIALATAEMFAPTHGHRFAPSDAVGNMVFGPSLAIMDWQRDAFRDVARTWERPAGQ